MEKLKQAFISALLWLFVAFCVILAIGMPFGVGTILMLIAAVMAAPLKTVRKIWSVVLGVFPQEKKKLFMSEKKYAQKKKSNAKATKALVIMMVFLFGFVFGMAATETPDSTSSLDSGYMSETPDESIAETTEPATKPTTEQTAEPTTEPTTEPTMDTLPESDSVAAPDETINSELSAGSSFSVRYIDVGQADAALIECDGHYMLIDGGNKGDSSLIYSVLKQNEIKRLDIIVGTHAHEDHIGGLPGALNYAKADITLCPAKNYDSDAFGDFKKYVDINGGGITVPSVGDTFSLGSAIVKILGVNEGSDPNNTSIVLRVDYGSTSFLFTGDAEREAEQAILNYGADLSATVLKVGHHGSDTSTTYPFLREVMPEYAVISVGAGNSYGHPTEDTLSRLRDADVKVYRTDLQGDIICRSDGVSVTFETERNADADVFDDIGNNSTQQNNPSETTPSVDAEDDGQHYVVNKNTKKFHYPSCSSADDIKPSNRWDYYGTEEELTALGYVPCKRCH